MPVLRPKPRGPADAGATGGYSGGMIHAALSFALTAQPATLPVVRVSADNTVIDRSCVVEIAPGAVIADADGDGVIHVRADGVTVEFAPGAVLRGCEPGTAPDVMTGVGVRLHGHAGVTLRGLRVEGFKVGVHASHADGLVVEDAGFRDLFRQRLRSTPRAEDGADWLWPHRNDENEWMTAYGGALVVEDSRAVTVRGVTVREGQNGIILDRVDDSKVYDNDCSFLSGWGLAMWRSSGNTVSRNALDFCVRGYSHGVYNRGQDSAGILFFEQCNRNLIAENSATHGGDGFFGFGGREALGETPPPPGFDHARRGCNDNLIINNDFSYAPAHGIEMTFSFGNRFVANRLHENAICGIWGGYSQDSLVAGNDFFRNGGMAYGLERGGVNVEHGSGLVIEHNRFAGNACGVHLWSDNDAGLLATPWARANHRGSTDNVIRYNEFIQDKVGVHLRSSTGCRLVGNRMSGVETDVLADEHSEYKVGRGGREVFTPPTYEAIGATRPVGARDHLRGRQHIIMTEWGPWDHQSPLARRVESTGGTRVYELHHVAPGSERLDGENVRFERRAPAGAGGPWTVEVIAASPGVARYEIGFDVGGTRRALAAGTIVNTTWNVTFFPWEPRQRGEPVPPADAAAWRAGASGPGAVTLACSELAFRFGMGGPGDLGLGDAPASSGLGSDYFGCVARTSLPLRAGRWRVTVQSDDGVRVLADGKVLIENWTHHAPTTDRAVLELDADRTVELVVEHFEIFGFAVLELAIEPEA